mgnify:CR=1 FL=1
MVMPSASLTLGDKILIQMVSGLLFFVSAVWCGHQRIRSIGIANFPLGFALFCKFARPFAAAEIREQLFRERKEEKKQKEADAADAAASAAEAKRRALAAAADTTADSSTKSAEPTGIFGL